VGILCTVSEWQLSSLERLHLVLASCLHVERPTHTRGFISETTLARQCREHVLAGTFTSVCCCEESLHMQDIYSPYCARPARACRGKNDKSFAHPGEYSLGRVSAAGTLHEGIQKFVGSRRLTSHPVAVPRWDKDSDSKWEMHWKIYDTLRFLFNVSICLTTTIFLSARLYIFLEYQCVPCDQ